MLLYILLTLERAGKTKWNIARYNIAKAITAASPTKGNGSITAFPIIETINCDVTE